jgi:hypothetical protein
MVLLMHVEHLHFSESLLLPVPTVFARLQCHLLGYLHVVEMLLLLLLYLDRKYRLL